MSDRSPAPRVIFLGGLGRSGTTLLERLLGESPGVAALGEVVHLWARGVLAGEPCGCGEGFAACAFWRAVGERAFGGWSPALAEMVLGLRGRVDRTRRVPRMGHRDLDAYVSAYRRVYQAAAEVAGARLVIDSSKHASLAWCLAVGGIDVHVVHVVRDPRAVAHSWRRGVERPEDGRPMTRWGPVRTSLHWTAQNLALELLARRGVPVTRVRYEDLMGDPRATLGGLAVRLGLEAGLPYLEGSLARLSPAHTASGNPMRFTVGPISLARDDTWQTGLPPRHRHLVTALTAPLMHRYGYRPLVPETSDHAPAPAPAPSSAPVPAPAGGARVSGGTIPDRALSGGATSDRATSDRAASGSAAASGAAPGGAASGGALLWGAVTDRGVSGGAISAHAISAAGGAAPVLDAVPSSGGSVPCGADPGDGGSARPESRDPAPSERGDPVRPSNGGAASAEGAGVVSDPNGCVPTRGGEEAA
ncbi:hypothetical protein ACIBEJ_31025 [Nonomuraea sp. NPDC050790]|uniref:hypothetical protein n=1 Tax=Nonomuraea sp. NPDC050790 TaxID=3364371 RepID=UPI0037BCB218